MATDQKTSNTVQPADREITWLPAILNSADPKDKLIYKNSNGFVSGTFDIYMTDGTVRPTRGIRIDGFTKTANKPKKGTIYKIEWETPSTGASVSDLISNPNTLKATLIASPDDYNEYIEAKKWLRTENEFNNPADSNADFDIRKLVSQLAHPDFASCSIKSPKSLKQALDMMAETDSHTGVYGLNEGTRLNTGYSMIVANNGMYVVNANSKKTPFIINDKGVKVSAQLSVKGKVESEQEITGIKAKDPIGSDMLPAGTILTPRMHKFPDIAIIAEYLVLAVDMGKIVYDMIDYHSKVDKKRKEQR